MKLGEHVMHERGALIHESEEDEDIRHDRESFDIMPGAGRVIARQSSYLVLVLTEGTRDRKRRIILVKTCYSDGSLKECHGVGRT